MRYFIILLAVILYIWWTIYSIIDIKNYFKYKDEFTLTAFSWSAIHFTLFTVLLIKLFE